MKYLIEKARAERSEYHRKAYSDLSDQHQPQRMWNEAANRGIGMPAIPVDVTLLPTSTPELLLSVDYKMDYDLLLDSVGPGEAASVVFDWLDRAVLKCIRRMKVAGGYVHVEAQAFLPDDALEALEVINKVSTTTTKTKTVECTLPF